MKNLRSISLALLIAVFGPGAAWSQTVNATLLGTVTDSSGAVVQSAKVTITETQTGVAHNTQSNDSGNYIVPNLPPGVYAVTVEATGFKKESRRAINLLVNTNTRVDVQLTPGSISETVEVSANAAVLQTDTASTTQKIEREVLANVPLIASNRNFQSLLNLAPGVAPVQEQHSQFFNASSSLQTEVNGQMRQGNNFMIEGSDDNERTGLLQMYIPPIEAIQTVDVSLTNHDPEMGRASGAVVNVLLKSGTNDIHGAVYEFLQNSAFNARSFFNPSVGHLAYNYVGGNIGGAIKKNKIFYFGDYLRTMDHEANTNLVTAPPNPWRTGDLSGSAQIIYDPATGNPLDGTGRTPFAGNMIPSSRINPVSAKIMALVPSTNQTYKLSAPSNNYFALLPFTRTVDSFDTKIDYNLTDKDRLTGRFSYSKPVIFQAPLFGTAGGPGPGGAFMGTGFQRTYVSGINYDRIVSPTLVAELRLAVSHYHNEANPSDYGSNDATNIGIPGVNISQFTSGMVGINIQDGISNPVVGYSASLPWIRAEANVDVVNTWVKTKGNHTIKWGVDLKRLRDDLLQDQTYSPRGIFDFSHYQTAACNPIAIGSNGLATSCNPLTPVGVGNSMASFLLDTPDYIGRDVNTYFPALRAWEFFAFAGDTWQVSPKLTLNLGVRWEFYPPATPAFPGGFSNYDPNTNTLVQAGVGSNPMNLGMKTHYGDFAPRVGLAYRLSDKTVIRAGFGTSYTPFPDNTYAYNYPVRSNNNYNNIGDGYATTLLPNGQPSTFQAGFPAPVPVPIPSTGIIPATGSLISSNFDVINLNFKNPYTETWNLAVQRSLPGHWSLDLAYVGVHGVDTVANIDLNNPFSGPLGGGTNSKPLYALYGKSASATLRWAGYSSSYNALQAKIDRRYGNLTVTTAFAWQKAMNYQTGDDGNLLWLIEQRRSYARADFDRTLNYTQSFVYQLPWGKGQKWLTHGPATYALGGWQLSGVLSLLTGTPFYFGASGSSLNTPGETQTADQVAPIQILHGINTGNQWFSTSSLAQPTGVRFGTTGRNILSGPGTFGLNLSMSKTFAFTERIKMEMRAETFNFTNTPQFSNPQGSLTNSSFGYVTGTLGSGTGVNGTGGGRALQLGVKLSF
jgi:hypothetical protein